MKYYEDRESYFLKLVKNQLDNISKRNFNARLFFDSWYKLNEINKSKYCCEEMLLYRNWMFHVKKDDRNGSLFINKLMNLGVTGDNFNIVFLQPIIKEIERKFNFIINNYLDKSYLFYSTMQAIYYQKLIPTFNSTGFVDFLESQNLSSQEIEELRNNNFIGTDIEWKIIGSIMPMPIESHEKLEIIFLSISCFIDQTKLNQHKKIISDVDEINDYIRYTRIVDSLAIVPVSDKVITEVAFGNNLMGTIKRLHREGITTFGRYSLIEESFFKQIHLPLNTPIWLKFLKTH